MLDAHLKELWKNAPSTEKILFDRSKLLLEMESSFKKMNRALYFRNMREIGVALILLPAVGVLLFATPYLISKLGLAISMVGFIYIIYKLRDTRKKKPREDVSVSLREQLIQIKEYLRIEQQLLDSVFYWYLLLPGIGLLLYFLGLENSLQKKIIDVVILLLIFGGIYWLNKLGAKKQFDPIIKEVEEALEGLE